MSMTREELQNWFIEWLEDYYDELHSEDELTPDVAESVLTALRPVSQDQEENVWRGEWRDLHGDKMVGIDDAGKDVYRHYHYSGGERGPGESGEITGRR